MLLCVEGMECDRLQCPFESNMAGNSLGYVFSDEHYYERVPLVIQTPKVSIQCRPVGCTKLRFLGKSCKILAVPLPISPKVRINPILYKSSNYCKTEYMLS